MRIHYDAEADILLMELSSLPPADAVEERDVIVSYDAEQRPVSVEFLHASQNLLVRDGRVDIHWD